MQMPPPAFAHAVALQQTGDLDGAEAAYRHLLSTDPSVTMAVANLGAVLKRKGRIAEAVDCLHRAIALEPGESVLWHNLGILLRDHDPVAAEAACRRAVILYPGAEPLTGLSAALRLQGRLEEAAEALVAAHELDPSRGQALPEFKHRLNPDYPVPEFLKQIAAAQITVWDQAGAAGVEPVALPVIAPPPIPPGPGTGDRPFWSVMIPTRRPKDMSLLFRAIGSVLDQGWPADAMQVAVVDNSGEATGIAEAVGGAFGRRVEYHRNEESLPIWGSWNRCIERARGRVVHILHDDDYVFPGFHDTLAEPFRREEDGVGAAFCNHLILREAERLIGPVGQEAEQPGLLDDFFARIGKCCCLQAPSIVVARRTYETLGGFAPFRYYLDWEMWARIAQARPVWYTPRLLAAYRVHAANTSATDRTDISPAAIAERVRVLRLVTSRPHPRREEVLTVGLRLALNNALAAAIQHMAAERSDSAAACLLAAIPSLTERSMPGLLAWLRRSIDPA